MNLNYRQENTNIYWSWYLDYKYRLDIIKDNYSFYLDDEKLDELLKKKCAFWNKRNLTYKWYIRSHYTEYKDALQKVLIKTTSLEDESDAIFLWANDTRIRNIILDIPYYLDKELLNNNKFSIYKPNNFLEVEKLLNDEYFLFDTETTWFSKLSQIIEFWWILYNRKIYKNRINEARDYWKKTQESVLNIFNYISDELLNSNTELFNNIKDISENINLDINEKKEKLKEITNVNENIINRLKIFDFKYNKVIHFYIKPYKDFSNSETLNVHKIKNEKLIEEWKDPQSVVVWLYKLLHNKTIIAHNVEFDILKLIELFNDFDYKIPPMKKIIDSIHIFQKINEELGIFNQISKYSLSYLSKLYLWIDPDIDEWDIVTNSNNKFSNQRHTAIYDVKLTNQNIQKSLSYTKRKDDKIFINDLLLNINKWQKSMKNNKNNDNQNTLF